MKICVYPGSFDPITLGHLDIITRGSQLCDRLIVCVMVNTAKRPAFPMEKRLEMIKKSVAHLKNVTVDAYEGLLVDYIHQQNASIILRGLRAVSDFEHEFAMSAMTDSMADDIETLFLMTRAAYSFLSSSLVREVAKFGGDVSAYVPKPIVADVKQLKDK